MSNLQLLKWIGNKHSSLPALLPQFPAFNRYFEPFLGSGAVLGALAPQHGVASDTLAPLIAVWNTLKTNPDLLKQHYAMRYNDMSHLGKREAYARVLAAYNAQPNGADLLWLSRSCYGGVIRFRRKDGAMSTPVGVHDPIHPAKFAQRVDWWQPRIQLTQFRVADFADTMHEAQAGDLVYCDPPYSDSQKIVYGAHSFTLTRLFASIAECKARGVQVALSWSGTVGAGTAESAFTPPPGLFVQELRIAGRKSMLKRLQPTTSTTK